jgi:hypothetical protein
VFDLAGSNVDSFMKLWLQFHNSSGWVFVNKYINLLKRNLLGWSLYLGVPGDMSTPKRNCINYIIVYFSILFCYECTKTMHVGASCLSVHPHI